MDVFTGINSSCQQRCPDGKSYHKQCENRKRSREEKDGGSSLHLNIFHFLCLRF